MCKEKLDLDIPVSSMDCCHRLAGKEGQHRPIIVKFISRNTKKVILNNYGIPEVPTEKTDEVVTKMCKEKLDLDIPVSSMDCCHRLAGKEGQHRPIIVKFISRNTKKVILNNKRKLKNTKIVIREDLTRRRAQLLRNAAARFGHRSVWSNDGNVMVKMNSRIRKIVSEDDLRQMDLSCA
ncbi:hypothetical protein QE152_g40423 [Popillia japonica]|uniref:Uncharacterized protein n=1 Tax=Popillia japonica TaxID=7064 RepID=A0AAW1HR14_POPJA